MLNMFGAKAREGIKERGKPKSYSHTIDGETQEFDLKKVGGKWKVQPPEFPSPPEIELPPMPPELRQFLPE